MRILVDAHIFDDPFQGTRTYLKGLYSELLKIDNKNEYFFVAKNVELLREELGENKNSHFIKFSSSNKYYRLAVEIPLIIRRYKIDVAHFQYISPLFKTCKEIVTIHDVLFIDYRQYFPFKYRLIKNLLYKRSAKRADLLLTVSDYSRKAISHHYGVHKKNIFITPNGVADEFFDDYSKKPQDRIDQEKFILYVSRIEPRKNHINLVKAFNELELWDNGYSLICVGKRDLKSTELDVYLEDIPDLVKEKIHFKENVSHNDLLNLYKNCNLFVFPTLAEGFGIPPIEAAAARASVICSNATAMADFQFFRNRLFDPEDLEELKNKISYYLTDSSNNDIDSIRDFVHNNYKWDKIAREYLEKINSVFQ